MTGRRSAFTLVEMLAVLWALGICLGFGMVLILAAIRTDQVGAATLRDLSRRSELADQFRADVARADAAPERLAEWVAGGDCLILRISDAEHVIYRWHGGQVERIVRAGDKMTRQPIKVDGEEIRVEFTREEGNRLVTLRILAAPPRGAARRSDVSAALGGDRR